MHLEEETIIILIGRDNTETHIHSSTNIYLGSGMLGIRIYCLAGITLGSNKAEQEQAGLCTGESYISVQKTRK